MKKDIIIALIAITLFSCTKETGVTEEQTKKVKVNPQAEAVLAAMTLTHNSDGTFSIDFGGSTDVIYVYLVWGNQLSVSGNVIAIASGETLNANGTYTAWGSATFYQAVVTTGSLIPVNGVVGTNWVFNYSNVVQ
jgi:hypothetical protein